MGIKNNSEAVRYTKYYEFDGRLRAYANRMVVLTVSFAAIASGALAFAFYVRLQPPTVVRVDSAGNAVVLAGQRNISVSSGAQPQVARVGQTEAIESGPTEIERRAVVRRFLERYLTYTPDSAAHNIADALNMMTHNFSKYTLDRLNEAHTIKQVKDGNITSEFRINSMEFVDKTNWTYVVIGYKEIHHSETGTERIHSIVGQYRVRLEEVPRSYEFPNGLAVAEYSETQQWGDQQTGLLQKSTIDKQP